MSFLSIQVANGVGFKRKIKENRDARDGALNLDSESSDAPPETAQLSGGIKQRKKEKWTLSPVRPAVTVV